MSTPDYESKSVLVATTAEGITTITINRPNVRNAVDGPTAKVLYTSFLNFERDSTQKVCILAGIGKSFCAGADLSAVAAGSPSSPESSKNREPSQAYRPEMAVGNHISGKGNLLQPVARNNDQTAPTSSSSAQLNMGPMGPSRLALSKPLIAVISGYAVAGGLELSLLADLRIAEEDATFGVFCRRFGVPLIDGGTVRLQRIVGLGRAMEMVLTGRAVYAQEALAMGLANRVVKTGQGMQTGVELARSLIAFPFTCLLADRRSVYYSTYEADGLEDALRFEFEGGKKVIESGETGSGARRFRDGEGRGGNFDRKTNAEKFRKNKNSKL